MSTRRSHPALAAITIACALAVAPGVFALTTNPSQRGGDAPPKGGVVIRLDGDLEVPPEAVHALVVVVEGRAEIAGSVETVVIVGGSAVLSGARVGELVLINASADLVDTEVAGDIDLIQSDFTEGEGVRVLGQIRRGPRHHFLRGFWVFGIFLAIGFAVTLLIAGLVAATVTPHGVRMAGHMLSDEFPKTVLWTLLLWIGLPLAAVLLIPTVIGIPMGVGTFLFVLPTLGFLGYLITGIRLGDWLVGRWRHAVEQPRPYRAALLGVGLLLLLGLVPFVGGLVAPLAGALGSAALVASLWQGIQGGATGLEPA